MTLRPPSILSARSSTAAIDFLQHEIMQEKASTLGRVTQAFEKALGALVAFEAEARAPGGAEGELRGELLDKAGEALWHFVVQREACGLRNTEAVLRDYNVPVAVRLRMRPVIGSAR